MASATDATQGMPSSRDTIMAWLPMAPTFTTTAAAGTNSGTHDGSVCGAMSTSPGSRPAGSAASRITRARPVATPPEPAEPRSTVPETALSTRLSLRRVISANAGTRPFTTNTGS